MVRGLVVATAFVFIAGVAHADDIADRKAAMKAMSNALKPVAAMVQGKGDFNAATVKASLKVIADSANASLKLYGPNTRTGKTAALPAVWDKKADFDKRFKDLAGAATAASGKITTLASLKANFGGVAKNCGGCHQVYRAKKK